MITPTTAFTKIAGLKKPIRVVQGGSSAGKTYSILLYLIYFSLQRKVSISIVAENVPVIKRGAYNDFIIILQKLNLYNESKHNKTDRIYHLNNSTFEFFGADDASKLRGSRRDILFINECNNVSFEAFEELNLRTRQFTFLDYNPTAQFWVQTEVLNDDEENADFLIVTYKDNEFLDDKTKNDFVIMEKKSKTSDFWANRWKVMGLGQLGIQTGAIFSDWSEIDSLPAEAELLGSGLDFGFTNDPTALVSVYRFNGDLILDEKIYQKGLLNNQLATLIKSTDAKNAVIYADSAEPKSIAELKMYGLTVMPVIKGKDSISYGIQLMQEQHIKVTSRSTNLIKELQNYTWFKDKEGKSLNIPIDSWNHAIDSTRYLFLMKFSKKSTHFSLKWRR